MRLRRGPRKVPAARRATARRKAAERLSRAANVPKRVSSALHYMETSLVGTLTVATRYFSKPPCGPERQ
jgi:hypothetical protein